MERLKLVSLLSVDRREDKIPDHGKFRQAIRSATRLNQRMRSIKRLPRSGKKAANPNEPAIVQLRYLIAHAEIVADKLAAWLSDSSNDGRSRRSSAANGMQGSAQPSPAVPLLASGLTPLKRA
jgi:hypothetical protein